MQDTACHLYTRREEGEKESKLHGWDTPTFGDDHFHLLAEGLEEDWSENAEVGEEVLTKHLGKTHQGSVQHRRLWVFRTHVWTCEGGGQEEGDGKHRPQLPTQGPHMRANKKYGPASIIKSRTASASSWHFSIPTAWPVERDVFGAPRVGTNTLELPYQRTGT